MIQKAVASFVVLSFVCGASTGAVFDWRDIDGQDFTTPIKDQGQSGACWAFSAVAALESKFEINSNDPHLNLDLSEQHLISDRCCGDMNGGFAWKSLNFFVSDGITDEATLPYSGRDTAPEWPLTGDYPIYSATAVDIFVDGGFSTENVKSAIENDGPLVAAMMVTDWFTDLVQRHSALSAPSEANEARTCAGVLTGSNRHAVLVIGYVDDADLDEGGYWIVKNSYGEQWGDHGYGYVKYGVLESYQGIHAITGQTLVIPEPSTMAMVLLAFTCAPVAYTRRRS